MKDYFLNKYKKIQKEYMNQFNKSHKINNINNRLSL